MSEKFKILSVIFAALLFISCNAEREDFAGERYGSINAGTIRAVCDESVFNIMDSAFSLYESAYPNVNLEVTAAHARRTMALLLSGEADAAIIARSYLDDEDSLMKEYDVSRYEMVIASDALVFFADRNFPLDTLNDVQIASLLDGSGNLTNYYPELSQEPEIVCNGINSSEFANIRSLILKDGELKKFIKTFSGVDSVKDYVSNNPNSIGIGFLSQVYENPNFKLLEIGFVNEKGNRVYPQTVHPGFVVQGKYPYVPKLRVYVKEDNKSAAYFWFASYLSKEYVVQKYLLDMGLVPEFAKLKLRQEKL
ncbi:MAG: substrate-binding domain-containing protein [Candidatus Kapaibacterium sp.]|jgi:ABC-type phosphate transport system substrate-binding protein|nr:substrate-binding domain-containing protein [Candidatus Kapabacteria bacterium]